MLEVVIDFITKMFGELIVFSTPRLVGIGTRWLFYLGKKPIVIIKKENWNSSIGFIVLFSMVLIIIYLIN